MPHHIHSSNCPFFLCCAPVGPQTHLVCLCMFLSHANISNSQQHCLDIRVDHLWTCIHPEHTRLYSILCFSLYTLTPNQTPCIPRQVIPECCCRCRQCIHPCIYIYIYCFFIPAWSATTIPCSATTIPSLYIYIYVCVCIYIYIHISHIYIYIFLLGQLRPSLHIYIYTYLHIYFHSRLVSDGQVPMGGFQHLSRASY